MAPKRKSDDMNIVAPAVDFGSFRCNYDGMMPLVHSQEFQSPAYQSWCCLF